MVKGQRQKDEAYDIARKEFYALRHEEEVERRVAKEEALWTGAHFGKGALDVGMGLEDKTYDEWLEWAKTNVADQAMTREAAYTSIPEAAEIDLGLDGEEQTELPAAA
ncbi:putative 37S ribosomal protein S25, mitochondrial [Glarea lozoyensis 74030]|uniref:Small ribosomal subunit protein mS23 n=1 Tax=Glarea lozoyensis (strain ATCC 74030 / MF5533) TaxID=1104152 RepID=H0EQN6_GLAL7|nr:putative 37S ribosomal protein S25, mitochondrial [Glarea lozoyensis 74030]